MNKHFTSFIIPTEMVALSWVAWQLSQTAAQANPAGGTVAQGAATFNPSGSQLTINVSTATAAINWQSFSIGAGETTTFVQPSATSVVWNHVTGGDPSTIAGTLNANGYVILQNQNGISIAGTAAITAHGLILTTSPTPAPDLSSGGPWSFNSVPASIPIINYGQINITGGGSAFLIADTIENEGSGKISAPGGNIGLYAGEQVLVSSSPDGRGLSAAVTLPQGSVDNEGKLIADGGAIAAQAQTVNQNGLVQANVAQDVNGVIQLVASDSLTLGPASQTLARAATTAAGTPVGPGGSVTLQAAHTLTADQGSVVAVDDGGISLSAATVNQNGALLANSTVASPVTTPNGVIVDSDAGTINVDASGALTLGASADLEARSHPTGAGTRVSPGGSVSLQAGGTLAVAAGALVAVDDGNISLTAPVINQNGSLQANSIADTINTSIGLLPESASGDIDLDAGSSLTLGATSDLEARGDNRAANTSPSAGGAITLQSGGAFADLAGSQINVSGGVQGGAGGQISISAPQMTAVNSSLNGQADNGFANGTLAIDTSDILLNADGSASPGVLALNATTLATGFSQVALQAAGNLEVSSALNLAPPGGGPGLVSLAAGNTLTVDAGAGVTADGGMIKLSGTTVNDYGSLTANSVNGANGVVELDASGALTLGAAAVISATGDPAAAQPSPGGFVVLQAGGAYGDAATSQINVGGALGGVDGVVEIFGNNLTDPTSVQAQIDGVSASQFAGQSGDFLLVNPYDLTLSQNSTDTSSPDPNLNVNDLANYTQIDLHAQDNIDLQTQWNLNDSAVPALVSLQAGNNLTVDDFAGLSAGNNWGVNLTAGNGIYLNGSAAIQSENGNINAWAANDILLATTGSDVLGNGGIRTTAGGNITLRAEHGNVNTGANPIGFVYGGTEDDYVSSPPYYAPATADDNLNGYTIGGVATIGGGNVTITAGGNVTSYLPIGNTSTAASDGGSGAFGPQPGNVTITAGGNVYGNYVLANGLGSITAGQNVGSASSLFALSLMTGGWNVSAPNGSIWLQEVRNPNGTFNNKEKNDPSFHLFDYAPDASVDLTADAVNLDGSVVPRPDGAVPVLYPPILDINAGADGVTLYGVAVGAALTLFPSPDQSLEITTTGGGDFIGEPLGSSANPELYMSDSAATQWTSANTYGTSDHGATPPELNDPYPVTFNISGDMADLTLITSKATTVNVAGNMSDCGFSGENFNATDTTSIHVQGAISNPGNYAFIGLSAALPNGIPALPAADLPPGTISSWDNIFSLAIDPAALASLEAEGVPSNLKASQLDAYLLQHVSLLGSNPGFVYDSTTETLGFAGVMSQSVLSALTGTLEVLRLGPGGVPETETVNGKTVYLTDPVSWVDAPDLQTLATDSLGDTSTSGGGQVGYRVGGPGQFNVTAGSISLGNSDGILSCGVVDPVDGFGRYANLVPETLAGGANVNVTVSGDLKMAASTIASLGGGDVNLVSTGGTLDLGEPGVVNETKQEGYGVYSAGPGDVNVTAYDDVDIDGSRIAAYDGGNIFVESLTQDINIGSGGDTYTDVAVTFVENGRAQLYAEGVYGSGIVANTLIPLDANQVAQGLAFPPDAATVPGNITVESPRGNITGSLGGITQQALDGSITGGPTINITAGTWTGTPGTPDYVVVYPGDVDLGNGGVIGGTINIAASGSVNAGLILSKQNTTVNAGQSIHVNIVAGGAANVSAGEGVSGLIVGVGGADVSGGDVTADVLSQNASVNGAAAQSTLGSSANASAASQSSANQSNAQAKQQLADNNGDSDDDQKKKKKPTLQRVKRVTVILPSKT